MAHIFERVEITDRRFACIPAIARLKKEISTGEKRESRWRIPWVYYYSDGVVGVWVTCNEKKKKKCTEWVEETSDGNAKGVDEHLKRNDERSLCIYDICRFFSNNRRYAAFYFHHSCFFTFIVRDAGLGSYCRSRNSNNNLQHQTMTLTVKNTYL